jgi:hypothetical protein
LVWTNKKKFSKMNKDMARAISENDTNSIEMLINEGFDINTLGVNDKS